MMLCKSSSQRKKEKIPYFRVTHERRVPTRQTEGEGSRITHDEG